MAARLALVCHLRWALMKCVIGKLAQASMRVSRIRVRLVDRPCYRAQAYRHRHAGRNRGSWTMKKFVFAVVIAAIAASPAAAATKIKEKVVEQAPVASTNSNENSLRFAKDSLPVFLPSWSMPAYMAVTKPPQAQPQR